MKNNSNTSNITNMMKKNTVIKKKYTQAPLSKGPKKDLSNSNIIIYINKFIIL